jgi:hypothetical protein
MADLTLIRQAERAGFVILWRNGRAYFAHIHDERNPRNWSFPFPDEDAAAIAALAYAETFQLLAIGA